MSIVRLIDTVAEWARVNICDHIQLKQPPEDLEAPVDGDYEYTVVNPAVFPMYVPTADKLPPNVHSPFPNLLVRFMKGQHDVAGRNGYVDVQFCFSAWNPGQHNEDVFYPNGDGTYRRGSPRPLGRTNFVRDGEGWRDVWNFVDIALRAVESTTRIGEYSIDTATPIDFGPLTEKEAIPDFYPMWFAWMTFRVTFPLRRNVEEYENFL